MIAPIIADVKPPGLGLAAIAYWRAANSCDEERHTLLARISDEPMRDHRQTAMMVDTRRHHAASRIRSFVTAIPLPLRVRFH
jgi:hypothetical protein